ncbi:type IX secretion system anionic LPS delivery protein PorZ [Flavobacterium subsaxonicum]|uniref:PorZ N-terminal beta-propeller domain-containing protein n=1 Tax=Flavobacterium subsaxonicum WB 4.1-42 = DSM 21790 TaxID=1121898 RepID=A0A0A2MJX0_9FLAO|nr:T9SS type A sorting domain-containing protein [Flavobacterium subsaxonicum]KGO91763.1 hypothetical protein Q766_16105 [Flavobacterium subsaxonicum WB 4.1-42 = DSM 21790]
MKQFLSLYIFFLSVTCLAQTNQTWGSYFSYYNTVDIAQGSSRVFAASESAIFSQNTLSGELKTITSVDGLKADVITAIHHSTEFNRTLVGNANGLLLVINQDGSIATKIDIVQEATVAASKKKINHIDEYNGIAYLSCDFGVAVFNLATLQFGDTYFLGPVGAEIPVSQVTVFNEYIYACTLGDYGIRRALLANPNLNDYSQWEQQFGGSWNGILTYKDNLFAVANTQNVFRIENGIPYVFTTLPAQGTDLREANGYMVITCANKVLVYDQDLMLASQINTLGLPDNQVATFTCATVVGGKIYIGTTDKGVYALDMTMLAPVNITPNGPLYNNIFSLEKSANNLWAVFGGYDFDYVPDYKEYGVSRYTANGWVSIPYNELSVLGTVQSISDISINPNDEKQVYLNSFHSGLLKVVDGVPVKLYGESNSPLRSVITQGGAYRSIRVNGGTFDAEGNLWLMNTRTEKPLKKLKPDGTNWNEYSFTDIVSNTQATEYSKIVIDKNNTKWIGTNNAGLIAYNETLDKYLIVSEGEGLPTPNVKSLAIDNNNRLWIGTVDGLRIISSVDRFVTDDALTATSIVFLESSGEASELLYEQVVTDIEVDGSNNKWLGTAAGAFLVSPDGQTTLFQFTKENSPLPSNSINDIEIDSATGEVFFATDKGMVSYKGTSTAAADDLANVYVYPNPVRPGFEGDVKISGLVNNANVKITDIEGNLVYETKSEGGTILWDTRAFGKYKVASGVYMIFIVDEDAVETKVKKVMIIRGN